jgi:predicted ArsR family transcriptional regulator
MKATKLGERFFESTRGRIVSLLRGSTGTVGDLAGKLGLTDNAVRAHLLTLERDGLVRQQGIRKGTRKPHFAYELTPEAEHLFPKPYDMLLNQFIAVVKQRLAPKGLREMLRAVGRSLATQRNPEQSGDIRQRLKDAVSVLESLGGAARVEQEDEKLFIRSDRCPLAAVVCEHPEVCQMAETLVEEIVGVPVRERCSRGESPRCCFEITTTEQTPPRGNSKGNRR